MKNVAIHNNHELYHIITSLRIITISLFERIMQPENNVTKGTLGTF